MDASSFGWVACYPERSIPQVHEIECSRFANLKIELSPSAQVGRANLLKVADQGKSPSKELLGKYDDE